MASINHIALLNDFQEKLTKAQAVLVDIANHFPKTKRQTFDDILAQIIELLRRIRAAATPLKLTKEVARAIARDCETIASRWQELRHYVAEQIQYDDFVYSSDAERTSSASLAKSTIQLQFLESLNLAGAMYGVAGEWEQAAICFDTVAKAKQIEGSPLAPLPALVRVYRCYEELDNPQNMLQIGHTIRKVLNRVVDPVTQEEHQMLSEATALFRKTAMKAINQRKEQPELFVELGAVYFWCEAEALYLISDQSDTYPSTRFHSLAEFLEQMGKELDSNEPSIIARRISNYIESAFALLRVTQNLPGLTVTKAQQQSIALQQKAANDMLNLLERLGYHQVVVVGVPEQAMRGLLALIHLIENSYKAIDLFYQFSQNIGETLSWAIQRKDQTIKEVATLFRWLCEGTGRGIHVINLKLIMDIYRVGIFGEILDLGSKEELRQLVYTLLGIQEDIDLLQLAAEAEIKFNDVFNLFRSLNLSWIAALAKQCQGQLRENISAMQSLLSRVVPPDHCVAHPTEEDTEVESPVWVISPSADFVAAAGLYSQSFRQQRGIENNIKLEDSQNWMPVRDVEYLKRRAAQCHWQAGIAYLREGNIEQGQQQLIRAKNMYELIGRYRDAIVCLERWCRQLVSAITSDGTRPTLARLKEIIETCDELVELYKVRNAGDDAAEAILKTIQFLQIHVGMENWSLNVFLRAVEYAREALVLAKRAELANELREVIRALRLELKSFLGSEFAIGVFPSFEVETTVYFETETPVKIAILNVSEHPRSNLTIRPIGVLPHLSPSTSEPWTASRDSEKTTLKHFYVGSDDAAYDLSDFPEYMKPADAFGPARSISTQLSAPTKQMEEEMQRPLECIEEFDEKGKGEQSWLGVMWSGDYRGVPIGFLSGATAEISEESSSAHSTDDLTFPAFFIVFTKAAREGNILPGYVFPVTFGIYEKNAQEPIATQTLYFKIASRPKILRAETNWATDVGQSWDETFSIVYDKGAHLPRYVPRFAPEFESKDYVNPETLAPAIAMGSDAVELTKYLKNVPSRFTLRYHGKRSRSPDPYFRVENEIKLEVPIPGPVGGEYEFLEIKLPARSMSSEELEIPRLRNGVNFQELFYGTVFVGDSRLDGEYFIYRLWCCFEPGEHDPAPGATYRQGWTNHRLDIFLDPKTWEPRLLVTDYYIEYDDNHGEWVEALYNFKAASSTLLGIRRLSAKLYREAEPKRFHKQLEGELRRSLSSLGFDKAAPLKVTGFRLAQRLGSIDLIRISWARDKHDGPVVNKPLCAHLFRDYWSNRYEHGLYRMDWRGSLTQNQYEMKSLDRTGGKSKYVRGIGDVLIPHEVAITPRGEDRCDLTIEPPGNEKETVIIRNVINPRQIELWTRPHISFSRRFNFFAKHFGRPPRIHTSSLYLYSTRRELNPYYKGVTKGKDQWIHFPEPTYWNGKQWVTIPNELQETLPPENLSAGINSWLDADTYWVFRVVWHWRLEFTLPLPHDDWERADIWVNARTGKIEWITSDYHWRELWYETSAKIQGINPIIDFLFNWNTPEPLTVKDGAQVHHSIVPFFGKSQKIGEFADQLPWMFARYRQSTEHLHKLHDNFWGRHKVKIVYGFLFIFILLLIYIFTPLRQFFGIP
jgi:hypothetical protein